MRRLIRLYTLVSSTLCGALLSGILFTAVALWLAPGRVHDMARGLSEKMGLAPRSGKERSAAGQPSSAQGPAALLAAQLAKPAMPETTSGGDRAPTVSALAASDKDSWIDVAALESRLRLLESAQPSLRNRVDGKSSQSGPAEWKEELEAWEKIRKPLFEFLAVSAPRGNTFGGTKVQPLPETSDLRAVWREVSDRLKALVDEKTGMKKKILQRMEPRAVARLLADQALPDAEALELLSQLSTAEASEVLERVSRASPAAAARLLRLVLAQENRVGMKDGSAKDGRKG